MPLLVPPPWLLSPMLLLLLPQTLSLAGMLVAAEAAAGGEAEPVESTAFQAAAHWSGGIQPFASQRD